MLTVSPEKLLRQYLQENTVNETIRELKSYTRNYLLNTKEGSNGAIKKQK